MPTSKRVGEAFALSVKGEDKWGNPSNLCDQIITVHGNLPVNGLPERITLSPGQFAGVVEGLTVQQPGDLIITLRDEKWQRHRPL